MLCMQITGLVSKCYFGKHNGLKYVLKYILSSCKVATIQLPNYIISAKSEFALVHILQANKNEVQIYRLKGHDNNPNAVVSSQGVENLRLCPKYESKHMFNIIFNVDLR